MNFTHEYPPKQHHKSSTEYQHKLLKVYLTKKNMTDLVCVCELSL